VDYEEEG
jgi:hypothetical protein